MSNLRFTVGDTYTFMRVLFEKGNNRSFSSLYLPWKDKLIGIECKELICAEHHKVTNGWDEEKNCDGFIFHDSDGGIWQNQYPSASYGQLDDRNDRIVYFHTDEEIFKRDKNGDAVKGEDGLPVIINQALYEKYDGYYWKPLELCTVLLGNVYRSVHPRKSDQPSLSFSERMQLSKFLDKLIVEVEKSSGKKVTFEPVIINYADGRPSKTSNYFVARVKAKDEQIQPQL